MVVYREQATGESPDKDYRSLKYEVAGFLADRKEEILKEIDRLVEASMPDYTSMPADVIADVRQSLRDFYQLYTDYFEADEYPARHIKNLATDVGRRRAGQGVSLKEVIGSFDMGETYVWEEVTRNILPAGHSAEAWVELAGARDRFTKKARHYLRQAYVREDRTSVERQLSEFRALFDLGQTIVSTVDLEKVLKQVLDVATSIMQVRMGAIMLMDRSRKNLQVTADLGLARSWVQRERIPLENSLSGIAIRRGEHVLARDDELEGFELPRVAVGRRIRSALSMPITVDEEPIGVIELYDTSPRTYTDLDITMITTFGPQAGVAIKNARLFHEEKKRRRQAIILTELAQASSETRDLDELLSTVTEKMAQALGADRCSLFFYEPEADALTFKAGYGRSTLQVWMLHQFHIPLGELGEPTIRALRQRTPVLVEDAEEEEDPESRIFRGAGVKSYMQVPLTVEDELTALMSLELTSREISFGEEDVELADALARQSAVAIQNRRLQERLFEQQMAVRNTEINESLYREREKSEAVLRATPDAVLVVDEQMKVVLTNPAAEYLTGWSTAEAVGKSFCEVLYGFVAHGWEEVDDENPVKRLFAGEQVAYSEEVLTTREGQRIRAGGTFAPIYNSAGGVENVVAVYRDIREQKELENYALMQREMEIASEIQSSLLPKSRLLAGGVNIVARQRQAKTVGGDWYDYWWHGDKVFLVLGDASGTGVPAALFAAMAMSSLKAAVREQTSIIDIMERVNQNLYEMNRGESFVTLFFGVLDLPTMTLSYTNAGHEEPLCLRSEDRVPETLTSNRKSLLGVFAHADLDVRRRKMNSGERLVLFTDGVIDAKGARGKLFGLKRLNKYLSAGRDANAEQLIDSLISNVLEFCAGEPKDDMTLMVCDIP